MIKDSGNRTEFETGAVRDIQTGKGRCDLLPLDVLAMPTWQSCWQEWQKMCFGALCNFKQSGNEGFIEMALDIFCEQQYGDPATMWLEVAIHFEEGAKKYGEHNWQKGIPVKRYLDSAIRHLLKHLRGDDDEPHDRAFCWNCICAIWTCKHKPELNDYAPREDERNDEAKDNGCPCEANP